MDTLTHTLTGLALGRAGLNRLSPYAIPVLLLAANAPDIDALAFVAGPAQYLHYHRHLTHSLIALPFLAVLPVLVVRLFAKKEFCWKWAYLASVVGVASHLILDWLNVYGVRWFVPFSSQWLRADTSALMDAWILVALGVAALAPMLSRLVSSEIGARPGSGRGWAIFALCFVALYSGARDVLHQRALATLDSRTYDGMTPLGAAALPDAFNPFRWKGLVETGTFYSLVPVNLLGEFDPAEGQLFYKAEPSPEQAAAAAAARRTPVFQSFLAFSQYPFWRFTPADAPEQAIRVEVMDLRFGAPARPRFVAHAVVLPGGRVERSGFSFQEAPR